MAYSLCSLQLLVDALIMVALIAMGMVNYYLVERTERKAFLEIRTCITSRHTISKENQNQVPTSIEHNFKMLCYLYIFISNISVLKCC